MEFKDLLELYKQGEYEKIIENADSIKDYNSKFLKIRSYYSLNRFIEAFNEFLNNENILLRNNFLEAIKLLINIFVKLGYDEPQILIQLGSYYEYENLTDESKDFLKNIETYIKNCLDLEKEKSDKILNVSYDDEALIEILKGGNLSEILDAISYIKGNYNNTQKLVYFINIIKDILHSRREFDLSYAILFNQLVLIGDEDYYLFRKKDRYFYLKPSSLMESLSNSNEILDRFLKVLDTYEQNQVIKSCVTRIIFMSYVYLAPEYLDHRLNCFEFFYAAYIYALKALSKNPDEIRKFNLKGIDLNRINEYLNDIYLVCKEWNAYNS